MGLNRCTVCNATTPEPDTAFCSNTCCDKWTATALVDLEAIREQVAAEARITHHALLAALEAKATGIWN